MLVTIETESKVVEVAFNHIGHIGLRCRDHVSGLMCGLEGRILTKLNIPWG